MKAKARQYAIRGVPPSLDRLLKTKAKEQGESINTVALRALEKEAGISASSQEYRDLDHFIGTWVSDPDVDVALQEQRKVDPRDWE